jgi:hypothetical protein
VAADRSGFPVIFPLLGTFVAAQDWLQSFKFYRST